MSALAEPDQLQKLTRPCLCLGVWDSAQPHRHNHIAGAVKLGMRLKA